MRHVSHPLSLAAALVTGTAMIDATAAHAQTGAYYVAVPAQQPTRAELMTRETPWSLHNGSYVAARAPERDATLCAAVARSAGQLTAFSVAGQAYDADALAKCNAHAKGGAVAVTVAQAH